MQTSTYKWLYAVIKYNGDKLDLFNEQFRIFDYPIILYHEIVSKGNLDLLKTPF